MLPGKLSAYLTIYNDWDLLEPALRSIAPYIDELVVVDGAYAWMAPYLSAHGDTLDRSHDRVYDILESSRIPYRAITGTWATQIDKRKAGYQSCRQRYVARIDADEVIFFDHGALERFFSRGGAVAAVEMPYYVAPGWISAPKPFTLRYAARSLLGGMRSRMACQRYLFDRERITPDVHLNYLWISRDRDKLSRKPRRPFRISPTPIGFCAHLTMWRPYPSSVQRAESYMLHYMLRHGVPWMPQLRGKPLADLNTLLEAVPAKSFREIAQVHRLSLRHMAEHPLMLAPTPLSPDQEASFAQYFERFLGSFGAVNRKMLEFLTFVPGMPIVLDATTPNSLTSIAANDTLAFEFETEVASANCQLNLLAPNEPWQVVRPLAHEQNGRYLSVRIPSAAAGEFLRREIELTVRLKSDFPLQRFRILDPAGQDISTSR